ncbi:GNAT family N-acetyltransferase [Vibrio sonorensis]|uniref:GNAT family N-acetyltransferase n=1 Tax=Vibrio sonorensis TaxID=1004316 RepID=UPI0008D974EE|nr:GNAT family protein [Vibrio sonorensis]
MSFSKLKQGFSIPFNTNCTIRLIQHSDLEDVIEVLDDHRVNQYLYFAPADRSLYTGYFTPIIENTRQAIANGQWPDNPTFVIRDKNGQYMGMTAVTRVMFLNGNFEVGYQLPFHAWGQGIATCACQLMTKLGFEELKAHKIGADCYGSNLGSYKTLEKCGYAKEGQQRNYYLTDQGFDDKLIYGLSKQRYFDSV